MYVQKPNICTIVCFLQIFWSENKTFDTPMINPCFYTISIATANIIAALKFCESYN